MNKEYRCICGKVFDNPQKFNGHKSNCKEHILNKYGSLESYYEIKNRNHEDVGRKLKERSNLIKEDNLQQWISEQHTCEKCGKVMTEKYGSGRFCSKSCANSHAHSEESKNKIRQSIQNKYEYVDVGGNLITTHQKSLLDKKLIKQQKKQLDKLAFRQVRLDELDLINSPYKDFDTVYFNSGSYKDCYYFVCHDENGSIIDRAVVPVYRYIVEYKLKRKLTYDEVIHHKDGNHYNNDINNLQIMTRSEHSVLHRNL